MNVFHSLGLAPLCFALACSFQVGGDAGDPSKAATPQADAPKQAAPPPAPRAPATREVFRGQLTFTPGMLVLDAEDKKTLDELAALLKAHPEYTRITCDGHCAMEKGCCASAAECQSDDPPQLANWRANVVRNELRERGIAKGAVDYEHRGFGHLVPDEAAAAKHRRVEFVVYGP